MRALKFLRNINRTIQLYGSTIRYLRWSQIWRRTLPRRPYSSIQLATRFRARPLTHLWTQPPTKPAKIIDGQFIFGGLSQSIQTDDIWHERKNSHLWLYQLHYFDDLVNNHLNVWQKQKLITRWIDANPYSINSVAWEPYPLSARLVNWCKWLINDKRRDQHILDSIAQQAYVLKHTMEYHILGNHLLMNAKALIFAGCVLENKIAERWLIKGLKEFNKQVREQILKDGGHMERSPMYHASVLEDMLDVYNVLVAYNRSHHVLNVIRDRVSLMLNWLQHMTHPNSELVYFNDTVDGIAPTYQQLNRYAKHLGLLPNNWPIETNDSQYFPLTGYAHIQTPTMDGYLDVAPIGPNYLPGHAHADTLCFELSVQGERLLVNQGIATYEKNQQRLHERSTQAHNTIMIDRTNSSQIWSGFRVGRRAYPKDVYVNLNSWPVFISAEHDGYIRQGLGVIHKRCWQFDPDTLIINDHLEGDGEHLLHVMFHIHPYAQLSARNHYRYDFSLANGATGQIILDPQLQVELETYHFHPAFGYNLKGYKLKANYHGHLPVNLTHRVISYADTIFN